MIFEEFNEMDLQQKRNEFNERLRSFQQQQQREQNEYDLKEIAHYYGGWDELQKVIDRLKAEAIISSYDRAHDPERQ